MALTKQQLEALNNSSFPNNNAGYITPAILRNYNSSSIAALVDENTYIAESASFSSRITAAGGEPQIQDEGTILGNVSSFNFIGDGVNATVNSGTASITIPGSTIATGSFATTASFNSYTQSNDTKVNYLTALTASTVYNNQNNTFAAGTTQSFDYLTATSASITYLKVIYQTSSVVYSSGSNILGDNANDDTQTLIGRTIVTGSLEVTGSSRFNGNISITGSANVNGSPIIVSSQTASMAVSSSLYSITSSYAVFAQTASEARNVVVIARNGNQSTLTAGTVVHITSAVGDNPIFNTASYDTELLSANTLGIIRSTTTSGADCEVVVNGIVTGVNTDPTLGYVAGDVVYLSSSGQFTRVQPQAPNQIVVLGQVLRAQQNQGSLYVSINNGWELNELHNVQINTPLTNDLLAYESSSYGLWKNKSFSSLGLATTSSVNTISSSVGLLQTFSSSQYKADSASFDSRINAATGSGGSVVGVITTGSATTASQTILGDFKFNTSYTGSQPITDQGAGGSNVVEVSYSEFGDDTNMLFWANLNPTFNGVVVNGPGVTNATVVSTNFGSNFEVTLSSGTVTGGGTYTFSGLAFQAIETTGSLYVTQEVRTVGPDGQKAVMDIRGVYSKNANGGLQSGVSTDGGLYTGENANFDYIRLTISGSQNGGPEYVGAQIAMSANFQNRTQFGFQGTSDYTDGRITAYQNLFLSQSLIVSGAASFADLTGSLAGFSASVDSRLDALVFNDTRFATTGSNQFNGDQTITGSINFLSGSSSGSVITNIGDTFTATAAVTKIISLSSAEYAALGTKDSNTLYIIV